MQGELRKIELHPRYVFLDKPAEQLICLFVTGHANAVFMLLFGNDLCAHSFNFFGNVLFYLKQDIYTTIGLLDIVQISGYHCLGTMENCYVRTEFLHNLHLVAGHDDILAAGNLLTDNFLQDIGIYRIET